MAHTVCVGILFYSIPSMLPATLTMAENAAQSASFLLNVKGSSPCRGPAAERWYGTLASFRRPSKALGGGTIWHTLCVIRRWK